MDREQLNREVAAFFVQLDEIYGHYLDSTLGFDAIHARFAEIQERAKRDNPEIDFDERHIYLGTGAPDDPATVIQHRATQGEFKRRNAPDGANHVRAAQLLVVLIFAFWESRYRASIASGIGIDPSDLKVPILGDLRRLRNDIVHCAAIVQGETSAKLEVLNQMKAGQPIILYRDDVLHLVQLLKASISQLLTGLHVGPDRS